jgi:tetratricopeptide (TPR) repeat protein
MMQTRRLLAVALSLTVGTATAACRPADQKTGTINAQQAEKARETLPPEVLAQIDTANEAFRAGDHQAALEHYTKARDMKNDVAAAWFGIYMAQHALGNDSAAQAALAEAQKISPGATLIHPAGTDTTR